MSKSLTGNDVLVGGIICAFGIILLFISFIVLNLIGYSKKTKGMGIFWTVSFFIGIALILGSVGIMGKYPSQQDKTTIDDPSTVVNENNGNTVLYSFGRVDSKMGFDKNDPEKTREIIDTNCNAVLEDNLEKINCKSGSAHGFISISENDSIKNIPINFGLEQNKKIIGYTGSLIAKNWDYLLKDNLEGNPYDAVFPEPSTISPEFFFWSGSNLDGSTKTEETCESWSDDQNGDNNGSIGTLAVNPNGWLSKSSQSCVKKTLLGLTTKPINLLCVCKHDTEKEPEIIDDKETTKLIIPGVPDPIPLGNLFRF